MQMTQLEKEEQEDVEAEGTDEKLERTNDTASSGGILPWIIMFVVVVLCSGAGFVLCRFFGGSRTPETAEHSQEDETVQVAYLEKLMKLIVQQRILKKPGFMI